MKLSLDALKERAGEAASDELLNSINGGLENACHDSASSPSTGQLLSNYANNMMSFIYVAFKAIF